MGIVTAGQASVEANCEEKSAGTKNIISFLPYQ